MAAYQDPIHIPTGDLTAKTVEDAHNILQKEGVVVFPLEYITREERDCALANTDFYSNANSVFTDTHRIPELTIEEKLNPSTITKRIAPEWASGMINQYNTPCHFLIQENEDFRNMMDLCEGASVDKYMANRIRIGTKFGFDKKSIHFDGKPFSVSENFIYMKDDFLVGTIIGLVGVRRFCWWDISDKDLVPLYKYFIDKGEKDFTNIDFEFMNRNYPGCRKYIDVDCTEHPCVIAFKENIPHEIAKSPSVSIFMSPIKEFDSSSSGLISYHPLAYKGLTNHERNKLGFCYGISGALWPSKKKAYWFCHIRAYKWYIPKVKNRYIKKNKQGKDTLQMRLPEHGSVDQHTFEYQTALTEKGIVLPEVAFSLSTPNFVIDLLQIPELILVDHGFYQ